MHQSWMFVEPVDVRLRPLLGDDLRACRRAPPRAPARRAASSCTNHCVEIIGSTTVLAALAARQRQHVRLRCRARGPCSSSALLHRLARLERGPCPANGAAVRRSACRRGSRMLISSRLVALAGREVVEVVRRRHLHRAGAELHVDQDRVGDDRDLAVDERMRAASCRAGAV